MQSEPKPTQEEMNKFFKEFNEKFAKAQQPLPPEFAKVLHDNYWDLLE